MADIIPKVKGKPHLLRHNRISPRPRLMVFFDTETKVLWETETTQYQEFRLGVALFIRREPGRSTESKSWLVTRSSKELIEWIVSKAKSNEILYVIASNPAFDLWVTKGFIRLQEMGWEANFLYNEGLRFILVARRGKATIKVVAIQNFFPFGVKKLGEMVGLPKIELDALNAPMDALVEYCKRDVEIIKRAFLYYLDFLDKIDAGGFALTLSSQAMKLFRHRFLKKRIWVHRDTDGLALERRAYMGGRSEVFYIGEVPDSPIYKVDVNSLYPFVMRENGFPINFRRIIENPSDRLVDFFSRNYCVVAEVLLETDRPAWGKRINGKLCFPVGRFRTYVCTGGLRYAINTGALKKVYRMAIYRKGRVFKDYVDDIYGRRQAFKKQGNVVMDKLSKLLLNSLYGKFGEADPERISVKKTKQKGLLRWFHLNTQTGEQELHTVVMGKHFVDSGRVEHSDSMPAVAAHVTEYGRMYLYLLMTVAGRENVYYCDTDSLFVNEKGLKNLEGYLSEERLGALKLEGVYKKVVLRAPKDYELDGEVTLKGIKKDAEQVDENTYEQTMFPGLKSLMGHSFSTSGIEKIMGERGEDFALALQAKGIYPVMRITKTLKRQYDKGEVTESGWVEPFRLDED